MSVHRDQAAPFSAARAVAASEPGLARYDAACRALSAAKSIDEVKEIHNQSEAMRAYAKQAKNKQLEIDASEIRFRAERRIGELMAAQREAGLMSTGAQGSGSNQHQVVRVETKPAAITLSEAGIDKNLADRREGRPPHPYRHGGGVVSYDPAKDSRDSYYAAIEAKRQAGWDAVKKDVTIGDCRLLLGDCLEILPLLGKVDAVVTDPPYGIGADKKNAHSSIRDNPDWESLGWDQKRVDVSPLKWFREAAIWGGNYFADVLPASGGWLVWRKPQAETGFSLADAELCWTNKPISTRMRTFPRRDGNLHPTQKPVAVMEWTLSFIEGLQVVDPYMGSGTTGVACIKAGKGFIGIEKHPGYFEIACDRIRKAYAQPDFFVAPREPKAVQQDIFSNPSTTSGTDSAGASPTPPSVPAHNSEAA